MSLGFEQAGFDIAFAIDRDGHHVATHARNFPYGVAVCGSVVGLTGERIRELAGIRNRVDLVFGGPPCQGFSHMGLRDQADPRNTLVDEFARLVGELRPRAFVMENVPGMQSGATKGIFERVLKTFSELRYRVTLPVRTLNAKDFGVPQDRVRLIILGLSEEESGVVSYPGTPPPGQPARPVVADAIAGLPDVDRLDRLFHEDNAPYDRAPTVAQQYALVARGLLRDPSDASRPREWDRSLCSGCLRVAHSPDSTRLYAATPPGRMVPGHKLPRLHPEGIAPTLRAGSDTERGAHTAPRPVHPFLPRCITAREAARLHGFPDWFSFYPSKYHAYRQIGNAVAPPVARAVGRVVVEALGLKLTYEAPEPVRLSNEFHLPEDRPRHERRVTQLSQYPKVIDRLFEAAYDRKRKRLRAASFSHEDIRGAIEATGANLSRTRPERVVEDIARNRGVAKMLAVPLQYGFSIRLTGSGGEFVRRHAPGDVLERDTIAIRSRELVEAKSLEVSRIPAREDLLALLERRPVIRALFGPDAAHLELARDLFGKRGNGAGGFVVTGKGEAQLSGIAILGEGAALPTRSRLQRILQAHEAVRAVVVAPLTNAHVMFASFELRRGVVREAGRVTYHLKAKRRAARSSQ